MSDAQFLFQQAIYKAKERKQTMAKPMIIHTADNRIFMLEVEPALGMPKAYARVLIYELREGTVYHRCRAYTVDVMEYETIAEGALAMLNTYLAEVYAEDEIAEKWKEFERNA